MSKAAVCALLLAAGCGSRPHKGEETAPKAVVLSAPARSGDSEKVARALHDDGYDVLRKSTSIARPRSTAAVYAVLDDPGRVERVTQILEDTGVAAEVLPFPGHAAGGNIVVVWLGEDAPGTSEAAK